MNIYQKMREYFERKVDYWYVIIAIILGAFIVDYGILGLIVPMWVCSLVAVLIIIIGMFYISIIYNLLGSKYKEYMDKKEDALYVKMDALEEYISDLNKKNIDLEKQLAQSVQNEMQNSITQMDSNISEHISNLVKDVAEFQKAEAEYADLIMKNMSDKAIDIQQKLSDYHDINKDLILRQNESVKTSMEKLEAKLQEMTLFTASLAEELNDNIHELSNALQKETNDTVTSHTEKVINLLLDKDEKDKVAHKENMDLLQNISEKAIDVHQKLSDYHDINKGWILQQNEFAETSMDKLESKLQEMTLFTASLAEEFNGNIHELSNALQKETNDTVTSHTEKVINLLLDKDEKDKIANKENIDLLQNIVTDIQRNRELHTASYNEQNANIEQTKQSIEEKVRTVSEQVNVLSLNLESLQSILHEDTENIVNRIEVKTENAIEIINSNNTQLHQDILDNKENIHQLADALHKGISEINETSTNQTEKVICLLQDMEEENNVTKEENIDLLQNIIDDVQKNRELHKISASEQSESMEQIKQSIAEKAGSVSDHLNTLSLNLESLQSKLREDTQQIINRIDNTAESAIEKIDNGYLQLHEVILDSVEQISVKTINLQSELTKIIVQILDETDEQTEKVERDHDRILDQLFAFSKTMRANIDKLQNTLENQDGLIHRQGERIEKLAEEQFAQLNGWEEQFNNILNSDQRYQQEMSAKLNSLNSQILSLNKLAEMIKNISAMSAGTVVAEKGPDRVEEIKDEESGTTIRNHYKYNKLFMSEMMVGDRKDYELEYDEKGKMHRSRTYGRNGEVVTELQFYTNGQVSTRIEKVNVNGKTQTVTSHFDEKGNKKI